VQVMIRVGVHAELNYVWNVSMSEPAVYSL
jgi:hypothetical protein